MEISEESVLEIWEVFVDHLPASKRNDIAVRFIKILMDQDIGVDDLDNLRGEDEHMDHALDHFSDETPDYDKDDYEN